MKNIVTILFFILMAVPGFSQVQSQFNGSVNVISSSAYTGNRYRVLLFFNDLNGQYTSDQLELGDVLYTTDGFTCTRFVVDSIVNDMGGVITCYVDDIDGVATVPPGGIGAIMRETPNNAYPLFIPGVSENLLSCIQTHFAMLSDAGGGQVTTIIQENHGFSKWDPVYWDDSTFIATNDTVVASYIVLDSIDANTFSVVASGTYDTELADGYYYQYDDTYSTTADDIVIPLFNVVQGKLTVNPLRGYDFGNEYTAWLKPELEAGNSVAITADTSSFTINTLNNFWVRSVSSDGSGTSSRINAGPTTASLWALNPNKASYFARVEADSGRTRLLTTSAGNTSEFEFYPDSVTLTIAGDVGEIGDYIGVVNNAGDGARLGFITPSAGITEGSGTIIEGDSVSIGGNVTKSDEALLVGNNTFSISTGLSFEDYYTGTTAGDFFKGLFVSENWYGEHGIKVIKKGNGSALIDANVTAFHQPGRASVSIYSNATKEDGTQNQVGLTIRADTIGNEVIQMLGMENGIPFSFTFPTTSPSITLNDTTVFVQIGTGTGAEAKWVDKDLFGGDGSTTNEIQTLSLTDSTNRNYTLSLSSGGTVAFNAYDPDTLSFASPNLSISGGNSVDLSGILTGYVSGSGVANRLAIWSGTYGQTSSGTLEVKYPTSTSFGIGTSALSAGTTLVGNVALGVNALKSVTTSYDNIGIGYNALQAYNRTSDVNGQNVGIGTSALHNLSTGQMNIAIGFYSQYRTTTGDNNVTIGPYILNNASGGGASNNTAMGYSALSGATSSGNTAIGCRALTSNLSGINTGIGYGAGYSLTTGTGNTLVGYDVGSVINTGNNNTVMGRQSYYYAATHSNNTILGHQAGYYALGSNNVMVGANAGWTLRGNQNIVIGGNNTSGEKYDSTTLRKTITLNAGSVNIATQTITINSHGFGSAGDYVMLIVKGTDLFASYVSGTPYRFLINDANSIKVASGQPGISTTGSGTATFDPLISYDNSISIGYNASTGPLTTKSNQVVLGNSSITETLLRGSVGIGGTPAKTLHVVGEARITDLQTDTPTHVVGADADGDLGQLVLSGLSITSGGGVDTLKVTAAGGGTTYTFQDGITESSGIVSLGGALTQAATISGNYKLEKTGSIMLGEVFSVENTNALGYGATITGGAVGVIGTGTSAVGVWGLSEDGIGGRFEVEPSSTNTVVNVLEVTRKTSGTAANSIGAGIQIKAETSTGSDQEAAVISSVWTNATDASRTSRLDFTTVNSTSSSRKLSISGSGQLTADSYGDHTFAAGTPTTTPAFDANGVIFEQKDTIIYFDAADYNIGTLLATNPGRFKRITLVGSLANGASSDAQLLMGSPSSSVEHIEIVLMSNDADATYNVKVSAGTNEIMDGDGTYSTTFDTGGPSVVLVLRAVKDALASNAYKWYIY